MINVKLHTDGTLLM